MKKVSQIVKKVCLSIDLYSVLVPISNYEIHAIAQINPFRGKNFRSSHPITREKNPNSRFHPTAKQPKKKAIQKQIKNYDKIRKFR